MATGKWEKQDSLMKCDHFYLINAHYIFNEILFLFFDVDSNNFMYLQSSVNSWWPL